MINKMEINRKGERAEIDLANVYYIAQLSLIQDMIL